MASFSRYILAPMAEITTPSLRSAVRSFSPDVTVFSEMLSAYLITHGGRLNRHLIARGDNENLVYQLLGNDPAVMRDAAESLDALSPVGININIGCSAPDILHMRCGGYLLKEKELVREIVRETRKAVRSHLSVKVRSGFDAVDGDFTVDFCRMLADEGADAVIVHGRAAKQGFRGGADWKIVRKVKESLSIPVIGNGDVGTYLDAAERIDNWSPDGVMIGRAGVQMPWMIMLCESHERGIPLDTDVDLEDICVRVLDGLARDLPEELHKSRAHRFLFYFTKNFRFGHPLMNEIRKEKGIPAMKELMRGYCTRNPLERTVHITL